MGSIKVSRKSFVRNLQGIRTQTDIGIRGEYSKEDELILYKRTLEVRPASLVEWVPNYSDCNKEVLPKV